MEDEEIQFNCGGSMRFRHIHLIPWNGSRIFIRKVGNYFFYHTTHSHYQADGKFHGQNCQNLKSHRDEKLIISIRLELEENHEHPLEQSVRVVASKSHLVSPELSVAVAKSCGRKNASFPYYIPWVCSLWSDAELEFNMAQAGVISRLPLRCLILINEDDLKIG